MATPVENLRHETARATAFALLDVIAVLLMEHEKVEALRCFHEAIYDALGKYEAERARLN